MEGAFVRILPVKLTRNQREILHCLRIAKEPLGAYAILDRVRAAGIAHPPTVYRALNDLMQLGMVHRVSSRGAFVACAHGSCNSQLAFAICRKCQKVIELPLHSVQRTVLRSLSPKDMAIERVTIELAGLCRACRSTNAAPSQEFGSLINLDKED
jgi:Fur family zinc uptake transcriptional regulator